jgi:hypothetical protein
MNISTVYVDDDDDDDDDVRENLNTIKHRIRQRPFKLLL